MAPPRVPPAGSGPGVIPPPFGHPLPTDPVPGGAGRVSDYARSGYILLAQAGDDPPPGIPPGPSPAKTYETTKPIDREVYGALGSLIEARDIDAALGRLLAKSTGLSLEKLSAFELVCMIAIETLATNPDKAQQVGSLIATMVINGNYPRADKAKLMRTLTSVFADAGSTPIQKGVILGVFDAVRKTDKADAFYAGLAAARLLGDSENQTLRNYIETYAEHVGKNSGISQDGDIGVEFLESVKSYTAAYPLKMYPVIGKMRDAWFANSPHAVMWKALMDVSGQGSDCEYEVTLPDKTTEKRKMTLRAAVESLFKESYGKLDLGGKGKIAQAVVRQIGAKVAPLHVDLLDYLIINGAPEEKDRRAIRAKVLEALVGLNPDVVDERTIVRCHFKLMKFDDSRANAIREGTEKQDLHHRIVKYMIDDDHDHFREPAHTFVLDRRPFKQDADGKPLSPIHAFGIPLLEEGAVEGVRDTAVRDKKAGFIVEQCNRTIDELYKEHRKTHGMMQLSGVGLPARTFMDLVPGEQPLERDIHGGGVQLDFFTKELDSAGTRFLIGGEYMGASGFHSAGLRIGAAWDLLDNRLFLKLPATLAYFRMKGVEDDRREVTFDATSTGPGVYNILMKPNAFTMQGGALMIRPELDVIIHRWQMGRGNTLALSAGLGFEAGLYYGVLSDDSGRHAFDPKGATGTMRSQGSGYQVTFDTPATQLNRKDEGNFGYNFGLFGGLGLEYQWQ